MAAAAAADFRPALLVVDVQEDFCPPNGSLAVPDGRQVAPIINRLLRLPAFVLRIATKDWHPPDHISFASNHPDDNKQPFVDTVQIVNPGGDLSESPQESRLWPIHCVQGTPGAELIPELDVSGIDVVLEKGTDARFEMYSPFYSPFRSSNGKRVGDTGLADLLRGRKITDVYVVGLAGDYCVRAAAADAGKEGFRTWLVEEGTRCVDPEGWEGCKAQLEEGGLVKVVGIGSDEVGRLSASSSSS